MNNHLIIYCPNPTDATSFYRGYGPLGHLQRWVPDVFFRTVDRFSWASLAFGEAVFMQRPFQSIHVQAAEMTIANKRPLWIDYDDDLLNVPIANPAYAIYRDAQRQKNVLKVTQLADIVTVSTQDLKRKLDPIREKAHKESNLGPRMPCIVVPNALDECIIQRPKLNEKRNPILAWRGSSTHDEDMDIYTQHLVILAQKHPNWFFNLIGQPYWKTIKALALVMGDRLILTESVDVITYMEYLCNLQPAIACVPLADNQFNRSKSNIAHLEFSAAGAAVVAPAWEEWQKPGVLCYNSKAQFGAQLDDLMSGKIDCRKKTEESWQYIEANQTLATVNKLRIGIIEWLMKEARKKIPYTRFGSKS